MEIEANTRAKNILKKNGINTYEDLLNFWPRAYKDYRYTCVEPQQKWVGHHGCFIGTLVKVKKSYSNGHSNITIHLDMAGTRVTATFIGQKHLEPAFMKAQGHKYAVFGELSYMEPYGYSIRDIALHMDVTASGAKYRQKLRIMPVYTKYSGISQDTMDELLGRALSVRYECSSLEMGRELEAQYLGMTLPDTKSAYLGIHFPKSPEELKLAQTKMLVNKLWTHAVKVEQKDNEAPTETFTKLTSLSVATSIQKGLPYDLTADQKKYLNEMVSDIRSGRRVSALLQGDVGCGKTMVAILLLFAMAENGYQGIIVAPTDILARQHYEEIKGYAEKYGVKVAYYSGGVKAKEKEAILEGMKTGDIKIIVGTQALCSDKVETNNLGMVIIDEEHRFGVEQKEMVAREAAKGVNVLYMSATPIPRTMAGAIFGNAMKVYDIHTMPSNRIPIQTAIASKDETIFPFLEKELASGRQVYVVCPLIEANEDCEMLANVLSAEEVTVAYKKQFEPRYKVALLNGKMKKEEMDEVIRSFKENEVQILVSTTVVEVGVNVPNSSVMVISNAERFGLATMHQLRGRVGRGSYKGYCILKSTDKDNERLKTMVECRDGFSISERDLNLRGAGDIVGTQQSGYTEYLNLIMENPDMFRRIQDCARAVYGKKSKAC